MKWIQKSRKKELPKWMKLCLLRSALPHQCKKSQHGMRLKHFYKRIRLRRYGCMTVKLWRFDALHASRVRCRRVPRRLVGNIHRLCRR